MSVLAALKTSDGVADETQMRISGLRNVTEPWDRLSKDTQEADGVRTEESCESNGREKEAWSRAGKEPSWSSSG